MVEGVCVREFEEGGETFVEYLTPHGNTRYWRKSGSRLLLDRRAGPTMIMLSGLHIHHRRGQIHREDGPAVYKPGHPEQSVWYVDGEPFTGQDVDSGSFKQALLRFYTKVLQEAKGDTT